MLTVDHKDLICQITIDRPPVNALNITLLKELIEAISGSISRNDHAIVLSGVPGHFCAGLDTKFLASATTAQRAEIMSLLNRLLAVAATCPIPVAAAVTGHCLGGGAVLAALCDYRVMARGDYKNRCAGGNTRSPVIQKSAQYIGPACRRSSCPADVHGRLPARPGARLPDKPG